MAAAEAADAAAADAGVMVEAEVVALAALAALGVSGETWRRGRKRLSCSTYTPRWFVRRLSTCRNSVSLSTWLVYK